MTHSLHGRDLLTLHDLSTREVADLISTAAALKAMQ
ncbi:MAG: ornithine carbamoyltransferase, partial [Roseiflexaceae bacterium]|nr:ornithine carbamoyltransferase [Roseiflexaceae bacterium]